MDPEFVPGLKLAQLFYEEGVRPLLAGHTHAAARFGAGSDVLGFDSERSTDHGWGPRLQLFVAADEIEPLRERLDVELPETFRGWPVRFGWDDVAVRHHVEVATLEAWWTKQLGFDPQVEIGIRAWLSTPQQLLLEATSGAVFADPGGALAAIRERLAWYPHAVWLYLMASQWRRIAQEEAFVGRTAEARDELGSRILTARLVRDVVRLAFLQERRYAPYAKWLGTAFCTPTVADELAPHLDAALGASEYSRREAALCRAYECVARRHNALGITEPVDPTARPFHSRPYLVIGGDRFADACRGRIGDPWLAEQPLVGGIDQLSDSTDVLSYPQRARRLGSLYDAE